MGTVSNIDGHTVQFLNNVMYDANSAVGHFDSADMFLIDGAVYLVCDQHTDDEDYYEYGGFHATYVYLIEGKIDLSKPTVEFRQYAQPHPDDDGYEYRKDAATYVVVGEDDFFNSFDRLRAVEKLASDVMDVMTDCP